MQQRQSFISPGCAAFDRDTGKAKGFAHIQFESVEAAAKAIGMSGQNFGSRDIFIDTAQERTGGGGGGGGGAGFERPQRSKLSACCHVMLLLACIALT